MELIDWKTLPPGRSKYQAYLASLDWALKRESVRVRAKGICEHCHQRPVEATHHMTYERIYREKLTDLLGVCDPCHAFLSGKSVEAEPRLIVARCAPVNDVACFLCNRTGVVLIGRTGSNFFCEECCDKKLKVWG